MDRTKKRNIEEANFYFFIESGIALLCSFVINLFVVAVFGHGLYEKTNYEVVSEFEINLYAKNNNKIAFNISNTLFFSVSIDELCRLYFMRCIRCG